MRQGSIEETSINLNKILYENINHISISVCISKISYCNYSHSRTFGSPRPSPNDIFENFEPGKIDYLSYT